MNRDSYLNFLENFNISNEDFIEYGLNDIIFVPNDKVISEWEILKNKVYSNQEAYIQMNIKVKQVKNMSIIDFCKVVIISNSDKI